VKDRSNDGVRRELLTNMVCLGEGDRCHRSHRGVTVCCWLTLTRPNRRRRILVPIGLKLAVATRMSLLRTNVSRSHPSHNRDCNRGGVVLRCE